MTITGLVSGVARSVYCDLVSWSGEERSALRQMRTDPVEIVARVSEQDGRQRAFDVWVHKVKKAGWSVSVESVAADEPGSACGVVDIEGLRYRIHHGRRVRQPVIVVSTGRHLIAAAVELAAGQSEGIAQIWEFSHAAWAEPILPVESS